MSTDDARASDLTPPVQLAYLVEDPKLAAAQWAAQFGAGPFFLREHIPMRWAKRPGSAQLIDCTFDHSSAYGWHGQVMIELFSLHGTSSALFDERPPGLHHSAHFVTNLDAALKRLDGLGYPLALKCLSGSRDDTDPGIEFAFLDARPTLGHYIELYSATDALKRFYAFVERAAEGWDGREPVRSLV